MMMRDRARLAIVVFFGLVVLSLIGCADATGADDHAVGVVFFDGEQEVARFVFPGPATGAGLSVGLDASATYQVRVVNPGGGVLPIDGQVFSIRSLEVVPPALAGATVLGTDQIVVTGTAAGGGEFGFTLWHGGHEEFRVVGIPLTVG